MNKKTKLLLSVPAIISLLMFISVMIPDISFYLFPSLYSYNVAALVSFSLILFQLWYLVRLLFSFENIDKSEKLNWLWFMIFLHQIGTLIFIWKKSDEFSKRESK